MFLGSGTRHSLGSLPDRAGEGLEVSNQAVITAGAHGQAGHFKIRAGGSVRREESSASAERDAVAVWATVCMSRSR